MLKTINYEFKEHLIDLQEKAEIKMLKELEDGNFTLQNPLVKYNPYLVNTLSAVILFYTEEETAITVRIMGKTKEANIVHSFPKAKRHVLPIVGLYSDYRNQIEIFPWQKESEKNIIEIVTPKVETAKLIDSMKTSYDHLQDQMIFLCPAVAHLAAAVDFAGDVRLDFSKPMVWDIKTLQNGHFLMGSDRLIKMPYFVTGMYEFSAVGKIYKEYRVPRGFHHDQAILPNGDIVALSCNLDNGTVEDQLVLIDKDSGSVKRVINYRDFVKPGSAKSGSWSDEDWFHCNSVWYDENTNSLTISGRHINAMFNIDFETEKLNWIISDPEGWPEEYKKYMFTPVGDNFEWQYEQHANVITQNGDVICFDNHHYGSQLKENYLSLNESYSRGVRYKIDTDKMEISQVWQYGKERGIEFFSPYISNVINYNENHYLIHSGGIAYDENGAPSEELGPYAKLEKPKTELNSITVETINDDVKLELKVKSNYYRANKVNLYNKNSNLQLGRGQILGSLGVTPTVNYDIPCEDTRQILPKSHEARVVDEKDCFTFYSKFDKGQLVILILEKGNEIHRYFISTSKGRRGAMCTGTFLSTDARDTRTPISKEGLDGDYSLNVIIDDKKYETGVIIRA